MQNEKVPTLTHQVGCERGEPLLCGEVLQALHFNGTLHIGIEDRQGHLGVLQELLKVPEKPKKNLLL